MDHLDQKLKPLKEEALAAIEKALTYLNASLERFPDDPVFADYRDIFLGIKKSIGEQWPLSLGDFDAEAFGVYSVRNLADGYHELDGYITDMAYAVKRAKLFRQSHVAANRIEKLLHHELGKNPNDKNLLYIKGEIEHFQKVMTIEWLLPEEDEARVDKLIKFAETKMQAYTPRLAARVSRYAYNLD